MYEPLDIQLHIKVAPQTPFRSCFDAVGYIVDRINDDSRGRPRFEILGKPKVLPALSSADKIALAEQLLQDVADGEKGNRKKSCEAAVRRVANLTEKLAEQNSVGAKVVVA